MIPLPEPDFLRAEFHGLFHEEAAPHGVTQSQGDDGPGGWLGRESGLLGPDGRLPPVRAFDDAVSGVSGAVEHADSVPGPEAEHLKEVLVLRAVMVMVSPKAAGST